MSDEKPEGAPKKPGHHSGSFLIRVWTEPREVEAEGETIRGFVRNLKTGEEQYLDDPQKLGEVVLQYLASNGNKGPGNGGDPP